MSDHDPTKAPDEAAHDESEAESDKPNLPIILTTFIGTSVLTLVVVITIFQYFSVRIRDEISHKQLEPAGTELRDLRASEQQALSRYQWVSKKDGVVRIPLDRARELTLREWDRRVYVPQPAAPAASGSAAPAASAAPAPATSAAPAASAGGGRP